MVALLLATYGASRLPAEPRAVGSTGRQRPVQSAPGASERRDVTFLVTADTHFGASKRLEPGTALNPSAEQRDVSMGELHRMVIAQMNAIAGKPYPSALGGMVDRPRGLLVAGDLTENGDERQWAEYRTHYGHDGGDGLLRMPAFAVAGNHDELRGKHVAGTLRAWHGGANYAVDWSGLLVVALSDGPNVAGLTFLSEALARRGGQRPLVLFFHYPLLGPYSERHWFGDGDHRSRLKAALEGQPVLGIFHGHYHGSGMYRWHAHDVYNVGSPKHDDLSFAVVRVTGERMTVASWNYELGAWWWWHTKNITPGAADRGEILGTFKGADGSFRPEIPYPVGAPP